MAKKKTEIPKEIEVYTEGCDFCMQFDYDEPHVVGASPDGDGGLEGDSASLRAAAGGQLVVVSMRRLPARWRCTYRHAAHVQSTLLRSWCIRKNLAHGKAFPFNKKLGRLYEKDRKYFT